MVDGFDQAGSEPDIQVAPMLVEETSRQYGMGGTDRGLGSSAVDGFGEGGREVIAAAKRERPRLGLPVRRLGTVSLVRNGKPGTARLRH